MCSLSSQSLPRRTCSLRKSLAILHKPVCNCQGDSWSCAPIRCAKRPPMARSVVLFLDRAHGGVRRNRLARIRFALYGSVMESAKPQAKKAADIFVLHCLNLQCRGLLAYEVDASNVLYVDLAWTAQQENGRRFLPCPKCGGKNIVEEFTTDKGQIKHKVTRWEPS